MFKLYSRASSTTRNEALGTFNPWTRYTYWRTSAMSILSPSTPWSPIGPRIRPLSRRLMESLLKSQFRSLTSISWGYANDARSGFVIAELMSQSTTGCSWMQTRLPYWGSLQEVLHQHPRQYGRWNFTLHPNSNLALFLRIRIRQATYLYWKRNCMITPGKDGRRPSNSITRLRLLTWRLEVHSKPMTCSLNGPIFPTRRRYKNRLTISGTSTSS